MPIPRVIGIETEYGIARRSAETRRIYAAQQQILDSTRIVSSVFPQIEWDYFSETELPALTDGRTLEDIRNTVLTNGARLYEDHGHPEYATPECTTPIQAVVYDKAGERIREKRKTGVAEGGYRMEHTEVQGLPRILKIEYPPCE